LGQELWFATNGEVQQNVEVVGEEKMYGVANYEDLVFHDN